MATSTKKVLEDGFNGTTDPTSAPQATTKEDVDAQDSRTRLWQSLNNSYNQQRLQSDQSYDKAYSQADLHAQSRGMGRSSFNEQTLANISKQKIDAQNTIYGNQIADYQNRLSQLEQQEQEQANWEKTFGLQQDQLNMQKEQFDRSFGLQEKQFAFQQEQWNAQQAQWREEFDYNKMSDDQKIAYNYIVSAAANGGEVSDDLLKRAGLSRDDYNAMKKSAVTRSGNSRRNPNSDPTDDKNNPNNVTDGDVEKELYEFIEPIDKTSAIGKLNYTYPRNYYKREVYHE